MLIFPSALTLHAVTDALKDRPDIQVGVQNINWEDKGAFTGENSAPIARAAGREVRARRTFRAQAPVRRNRRGNGA